MMIDPRNLDYQLAATTNLWRQANAWAERLHQENARLNQTNHELLDRIATVGDLEEKLEPAMYSWSHGERYRAVKPEQVCKVTNEVIEAVVRLREVRDGQ